MSSQIPAKLASKLKHIRTIELAYSKKEMAAALGPELTASDVTRYERGERQPTARTLLKYASLIGASPDLLTDDNREIRANTGKW